MFESMPDPAAVDALEPGALIGLIESTHRQESVLIGRRMVAVAALLGHRMEAAAGT